MTASKYTDTSKYCFMVDVSHWKEGFDLSYVKAQCQANGIDLAALSMKAAELCYEAQPIDDCIDDQLANFVQQAYDNDLPALPFVFHNPQYYPEAWGSSIDRAGVDTDKQVIVTRQALKNKLYHGFVFDFERWWIDYNEYNAWRKGTLEQSAVRTVSNGINLRSSGLFMANIKKAMELGYLRNVPTFIYTRRSFIEEWTRTTDGGSLYDYTPKHLPWEAYYPDATIRKLTWAQLKDYFPTDGYKPLGINAPNCIWQFTDRIQLPVNASGTYQAVDLNIIMMPKSQFWSILGYTPRTTETPVVDDPVEETPPTGDSGEENTPLDVSQLTDAVAALNADMVTLNSKADDILSILNTHFK